MAKFEDMRVKSDDQLSADLSELKREQFNLRFQAATNQLERPARIPGGPPRHRSHQDAADRA